MNAYELGAYFWSVFVALAVGGPVIWALAREAVKAIEHLDGHSHPSHPLGSGPSSPRPSH